MKKTILSFLFVLVFSGLSHSAVLVEDSFESDADWTVTQPSGATTSCYSSCGMPNFWDAYYNGFCRCSDSLSGEPGNNNWYINTGAGYPSESNACYSGTKCGTHWQESCDSEMENSDGMLAVDLGAEYEEIYVRLFIRFKSGWEMRALSGEDGGAFKLYHIQHSVPGTSPFVYLGNPGSDNNEPVGSGGINQWSNYIQFYAENRCQTTYYCHETTVWPLGTTTWAYAAGGIFDGDWHHLEIRQKRNSAIGVADGIFELWLDGVKKTPWSGYVNTDYEYNDDGSPELRGWRFITLGGNTNNRFDTSCSNIADCEQWYAIDDVVISTTYVGPDYVIGDGSDTTPPIVTGLTIMGGS